ncbi:MAG: hypothetical protein KF864_00455 [Phycisphaeraceae bacterium]|nr:hypothetical protein [Phycisphaeraceae bacterium]
MGSSSHIIVIVAMAIGGSIAIIAIIAGAIGSIVRARAIEASRREIAAYVAEGSIKPEDAAKLISATPSKKSDCC